MVSGMWIFLKNIASQNTHSTKGAAICDFHLGKRGQGNHMIIALSPKSKEHFYLSVASKTCPLY